MSMGFVLESLMAELVVMVPLAPPPLPPLEGPRLGVVAVGVVMGHTGRQGGAGS